jgi:hypothetical protein
MDEEGGMLQVAFSLSKTCHPMHTPYSSRLCETCVRVCACVCVRACVRMKGADVTSCDSTQGIRYQGFHYASFAVLSFPLLPFILIVA